MKYAWITKHKKRFPIKQMCRVLNVSVSNYYAQLKCERSQYTSDAYQKTLRAMGITCSMSRKGNCYDNAVMERFFCSLKGEWTNHEVYADLPAARISVFKYIEAFYNSKRIHQTLKYKTLNDFEDAFFQMNQTHTHKSKADHAPTCSNNQVA